MRRVLVSVVVAGSFLFASGGVAVANPTGPVTHPGQHNQDCSVGIPPGGGNSGVSPGSPFNGGTSGNNYAGQKPQNSANGQNSQYDIACTQQAAHL
jgi:hypothetical protein